MVEMEVRGTFSHLNDDVAKKLKDFIATKNEDYEIKIFDTNFGIIDELLSCGVKEKNIVTINPSPYAMSEYLKFKGESSDIRFETPFFLTRTMIANSNQPPYSKVFSYRGSKFFFNDDYVRYGTLNLIAEEIKLNHVEGDIAELGVAGGNFSALLNGYFPDRKLWLFDTFEGFDERDVKVENEKSAEKSTDVNENFVNDYAKKMLENMVKPKSFSDTNVELVLSKMTTPKNCVVRKGFFPDTIPEEETTFALVSLDCDLYAPILAGLKYFYPRIQGGRGSLCCMIITAYFMTEYIKLFMNLRRKLVRSCINYPFLTKEELW